MREQGRHPERSEHESEVFPHDAEITRLLAGVAIRFLLKSKQRWIESAPARRLEIVQL